MSIANYLCVVDNVGMAELDKILERQPSDNSRMGVSWVDTSRQAMFSDAVFSIIATIMCVTIEISEHELNEVSVTCSRTCRNLGPRYTGTRNIVPVSVCFIFKPVHEIKS